MYLTLLFCNALNSEIDFSLKWCYLPTNHKVFFYFIEGSVLEVFFFTSRPTQQLHYNDISQSFAFVTILSTYSVFINCMDFYSACPQLFWHYNSVWCDASLILYMCEREWMVDLIGCQPLLDCLNSVFLVCFYGISTIVGYLMPNPFLYIKQFYFKQLSLA